jgi:hypothetical protein
VHTLSSTAPRRAAERGGVTEQQADATDGALAWRRLLDDAKARQLLLDSSALGVVELASSPAAEARPGGSAPAMALTGDTSAESSDESSYSDHGSDDPSGLNAVKRQRVQEVD